jgi:Peptidase S46
MMRCTLLLSCLLMFFLGDLAAADPGMWLFEAFPVAKVKAKYGFDPTTQWLMHVRLSSVRFNNGGSGRSFPPMA